MTHPRKTIRPAIALAALAIALLAHDAAAQDQGKKIYCWNEGGKKVCGDALPASAADSARTEISARSGLTTGQVQRALTESERAAEVLAADEARLQAEADAMQKRRDLAMIESYASEEDLRRAYGERTTLVDETVKSSKLGLSNLRLSLLALLRQAGDRELGGQIVPKPMADSIRRQHAELLRQQLILASQQADRSTLEHELEDAVRRYRLMKGDAPPATVPGAAATQPAAATAAG